MAIGRSIQPSKLVYSGQKTYIVERCTVLKVSKYGVFITTLWHNLLVNSLGSNNYAIYAALRNVHSTSPLFYLFVFNFTKIAIDL